MYVCNDKGVNDSITSVLVRSIYESSQVLDILFSFTYFITSRFDSPFGTKE